MQPVRKSLLLNFGTTYSAFAIHFVSVIVLSRLLTPHDIGVYSVAAAVIGLTQVLRDFGVAKYVIQEPNLTLELQRAAFGLTLCIAWTCAALVIVFNFEIAQIYREPEISNLLTLMGVGFLIIPFGAVPLARLQRDFRFGAYYCVSTASTLVQAVVSIALAFLGYRYMSVGWGWVAGAATTAIMASLAVPELLLLRPSFRWRGVVGFGTKAVGAAMVNEAGVRAPDLVIGRLVSLDAVGLFSRAIGLVGVFDSLVTSAITFLLLPLFSAERRQGNSLAGAFLRTLALLTGLSWPFFVTTACAAQPLIRIMFGPDWVAAAPIAQILCLAAALVNLVQLNNQALLASGRPGIQLSIALSVQSFRICALIVGSLHGLMGAAVAQVVTQIFALGVFWSRSFPIVGIRIGDLIREVWRSAAVAGAVGAAALAVRLGSFGMNSDISLLLVLSVAAAAWLSAIFALGHPLSKEIRLLSRSIIPRPSNVPGE